MIHFFKKFCISRISSDLYSHKRYFKITPQFFIFSYKSKQTKPPYNHIVQIGDPVLRRKAELVPTEYIKSKEIDALIKQMIKVLNKYNCVGLAAPQIGINLQIIVMEFKEKLKNQFTPAEYANRQMKTLPLTVLINPEMKIINFNKNCFQEGCASVKGYAAEVERYQEVEIQGFNNVGAKQQILFKGWNARIAQHEMDHLRGKIFVDIMKSETFICSCWQNVNSECGRIELPFYK